MSHHTEFPVVCECGHKGTVDKSENDGVFSKPWAKYTISGFEGKQYDVQGLAYMSKVLQEINPKCPACGAVGKVKDA